MRSLLQIGYFNLIEGSMMPRNMCNEIQMYFIKHNIYNLMLIIFCHFHQHPDFQ